MAHIHEKIDLTVEVFIVYENKVLLRMHDKYKFWLSVGGHVELDEDPNQAAIREVQEEVGLEVQLFDPRSVDGSDAEFRELIPPVVMARHTAIHPASSTHEHITMVYFARARSEAVQVGLEGDRSDEWRWFTKEDLEKEDIKPNIRGYALRALQTLSS